MSLRLRLLLVIGTAFAGLWIVASAWMLVDLRSEFRGALDERLAASARMVAGLQALAAPTAGQHAAAAAQPIGALDGVACEIRQLRGAVVARTANSPPQLGVGETGYRTRTIDGQRWRSFTLEQDGLRVTTADRLSRRDELLYGVMKAAAIPVAIALAGSLVALWFGVRAGLGPLASIGSALAARGPRALQALPQSQVPLELAPLVSVVNGLLERLAAALERERRFTGDAAHELRTPLTAVKTHIQVARLSDPAGAGVALERAEAGVLRLQATIEQLMLLTRLDGASSFDERQLGNARAVARGALEQFAPAQQDRVDIDDQSGDAALAVPVELAVIVLRNLIDNAFKHGAQAGQVGLTIRSGAGVAVFSVADRGSGMAGDDAARASGRFWRKGAAQGSGLGLSIVDAIVRRYDGSLGLRARAGGGLLAEVQLPLHAAQRDESSRI